MEILPEPISNKLCGRLVITEPEVNPTKFERMRKPYSSTSFIADYIPDGGSNELMTSQIHSYMLIPDRHISGVFRLAFDLRKSSHYKVVQAGGEAEGEEDAFVVINLSGKVVKYNLISKTNTEIFDIGSNKMDDDDDDADDDAVLFIPPFEVDPNLYEFILSLASEMNECLALADLGASINLMPLSIWKELSLPALTKTRMILELADRTISTPTGIAEDVFVKTFSYNIIESVNRVDVIDIACEEYVQEVLEISESGNPTSTSDLMIDSRSPSFTPFGGSDFLMEEIDEFLEHDDSIPPGVDGIYDSEGDTVYLEELLSVINSDPNLPPSPVCEINVPEEIKSSCEDPPDLELKDLPSHLEYAFLEGDDKLPVIIAKNLKDEDKTALIKVLKSHKHAIAWKISNIKGIDPEFCTHKFFMEENAKPVVQHQRRVKPKIHEAIKQEVIKLLDAGLIYPISDSPWIPIDPLDQEKTTSTSPYGHCLSSKTMEVFMDDFSVFGDSFSSCLSHLDKMVQRCEDTNLVLNWEKCHFMVKKGIVLGYKISKSGIEVDKSKVDVIAKLPHPTAVKGIRSFLGHAGFYRRFIQDFSKIARPMTHLLEKETSFIFSKECIEAFETLKMKLTHAPILVAPNWDLPFEIMCDASDFVVGAVLGQRKTKHFQPIHYASKTMTEAQAHYTTTEKELLAVVYAFEKFRPKSLTLSQKA
ncbi:reverse transcriptase domain-containing protein [Tanacetum coccineum]